MTKKSQHKRGRKAYGSKKWYEAFLSEFSNGGLIGHSALKAGVCRKTVDRARKDDAEFSERFEDARHMFVESLEGEARRRAFEGTDKPVFFQGSECGYIREYSDTLMIFLLKGNAPEKYRERHEVTGPNGGPVQLEYTNDWRNPR